MLVFGRLVEHLAAQGFGHEFHIHEVARIVVGIFVAVGIVQVLHQLRGRIADGKGDRLVSGIPNLGQGLFQGHIRGVALGGGSQVHCGFRQGDAAFRHPYLGHHLEAGVGQQKGVGIGQAHIFGCAQAQTAGNEKGVFPSVNHARQVINGGIGVASADTLDKGRYNVVVHLAILVVDGHILLDGSFNRLIVNDDGGFPGLGVHHQLQHIEQFAGIPTAVTHERLALLQFYRLVFQKHILLQGPVQQNLQIGLFQRL